MNSGSLKEFAVEYAKSNRSKCVECEENIMMGEVRLGKRVTDSEKAARFGPYNAWFHPSCIVKNAEAMEGIEAFDIKKVPGIKVIKKEDVLELEAKLNSLSGKKRVLSDQTNDEKRTKRSKIDTEFNNQLKAQSKLLWDIRDKLSKEVSKDALIGLLEYNKQYVPKGEPNLLDGVSDGMTFGALEKCPECSGKLRYSAGCYKCMSMATEWVKCMFESNKARRREFKIPKQYTDVDVLRNYRYVPRKRLVDTEISEKATMVIKSKDSSVAASIDHSLTKCKFVVSPNCPDADKLTEKLAELGSFTGKKVTSNITAVICDEKEISDSKLVDSAKAHNVAVVSCEFVQSLTSLDLAECLKKHSLCSWGSAAKTQNFSKSEAQKLKEKSGFENKGSTTKTFRIKGGAVVDPQSELEDVAHLVQLNDEPLNAVLNLVDIVRDINSYYKLQCLEADNKKKWWIFRAWGRIGTTIGGDKLEPFLSKNSAVAAFMELFLEKTGNEWENRRDFVKHPGMLYPVDIDNMQDEVDSHVDLASCSSKLDTALQDLIRFVFDLSSMKSAMKEFDLDLKKMPLGKLSKSQIESAYSILDELSSLLLCAKPSITSILDASTRFYTIIPHDFGMQTPPLLSNSSLIKEKIEMLDNLSEIEVAYNLIRSASKETGMDPIEKHYNSLKSQIKPLPKESEEYAWISQYVTTTHAPTHSSYGLEIQDIFEVNRNGEASSYRQFKKLKNKMLLWHGSRRTNWAGILSKGLRIAPPEAPVTGYMFGKGIYFADMASKSANYCFASRSSPEGLLLLCEVALGNIVDKLDADSEVALKPGQHSVKGCGKTIPDPSTHIKVSNDVTVPIGKPTEQSSDKEDAMSLLYNEYVVYDIGQVQQKYLIKLKFLFK